ncbi:hypothetical protein KR222_002347 [Zaprionus bogoriensis]|nr:hypothetical protein KR222_002347 [Zaprionus bogoriensis]
MFSVSSWLLIYFKLLLLVTVLNARRCVKPNSTTMPPKTPSTGKPTYGSTTEPPSKPTTASTPEQSSSSTEISTTELPLSKTSESTLGPITSTTKFATETPPGAANEKPSTDLTPHDSTTLTPADASDTSQGEAATETTATTMEAPVDANNMCKNHPGVEYLPHPYNCHQYIQCDGAFGNVKVCSANLFWNSKTNNCGITCA